MILSQVINYIPQGKTLTGLGSNAPVECENQTVTFLMMMGKIMKILLCICQWMIMSIRVLLMCAAVA